MKEYSIDSANQKETCSPKEIYQVEVVSSNATTVSCILQELILKDYFAHLKEET